MTLLTTITEEAMKRFDGYFQDMDVWVYMHPITDPKGISAKSANGKREVENFMLAAISLALETVRGEVEKMKKQAPDSVELEIEQANEVLDQVLTLLDKEKEKV